MYPERSDSKFSNIYPEIWKKTKTNRTIQIEEKDQIITTATVTPLEDSLKSEFVPKWILINTINLNDTAFSEEKFNRDLLLYTLLSAVIIGLITFLLAKTVFQRNNYQRELKHAALYDTLTNLPNRKLLIERATQIIENTVRYDDSYALLFIDLDGFKGVNDTMGHEAGDQLLQIAASKMQSCVRSGDTVARIGGDEFVVLLPRVETSENCLKVAQKILSQICSDFQLKTGKIKIGASIGVIVSRPNNHHTLDEVLKKADELMYEVKKNGKGAIKLYDTENEE